MKSLVIAALLTAAPQATPDTPAIPGGGATPAPQAPSSASVQSRRHCDAKRMDCKPNARNSAATY